MHIEKKQNDELLVSIIVLSYNSSKYILETLESAKKQTYSNIELIVADDASTDNTIEIVKTWLIENRERFIRVKIVESVINGGIPANCNKGLDASTGEWLKYIAGDDILINTCIEDNINFIINSSDNVFVVHSEVEKFVEKFQLDTILPPVIHANDLFNTPSITAIDQYKLLLRKCWVESCSTIYKKELFEKAGRWDELVPIEDVPFWLRITKNGYKIYFLNKKTVNYRIHTESYSNYNTKQIIFNGKFIKNHIIYHKYMKNDLFLFERFFEVFDYYRKLIFVKLNLNKYRLFNRILNKPFVEIKFYYKAYSIHNIEKKIGRKYLENKKNKTKKYQ
jgi:glycosyltransferase involved in cell wall biosynthesis